MKIGGSKPKGNAAELDRGKELSLWLSHGERSDLFVRNVTSGAAFTVAAKKGKFSGIPGDLMASDDDVRSNRFLRNFSVEVKHWKNLYLELALWNPKEELYKQLFKFIDQCKAFDRYYLFIAKQNYKKTLLFYPNELNRKLVIPEMNRHMLWINIQPTIVCRFDDFVNAVQSELMIERIL